MTWPDSRGQRTIVTAVGRVAIGDLSIGLAGVNGCRLERAIEARHPQSRHTTLALGNGSDAR
jgi:hypothetical protein